jgi:hypothetical protein
MKSTEQKLEQIMRRMAADRAEDAPADAIRYAKNLFRTRAVEAKPTVLRRILASLQVDLEPNRAAFGERSAAGAEARQMLFDAEDNAVDLRVTAAADRFDVRGQVLGAGFEAGEATIMAGELQYRSPLDAQGGFSFGGLEAGEYSLTISGRSIDIQIEKIIL